MEREETIRGLKRFFGVGELVCPHTFARWGEGSWRFLGTDYLSALLVVRRDILKRPMLCNGGQYTQRGLRCNRCALVRNKREVYLSAHVLGLAGDFDVDGMTAGEARDRIRERSWLLPCGVRLEDGVGWLHMDTLPQEGARDKVYMFKA